MSEAERSDALATIPAPAKEAPTSGTDEIRDDDASVSDDPEPEGDAPEGGEPGEGEEGEERRAAPEPADDGTEEIEVNGKKLKIPREARPLLMAQADYTRNIQRVSEKEKALDAAHEQHATISQERIAAAGRLANADEMVDRYQKLDWVRLEAEDRELASTRQREMIQWQFARDTIAREVAGLDAQSAKARETRELEAQQATVRRAQEARVVLEREIPNWSTVSGKVAEYAMSNGYTFDELALSGDPRLGKMLHQAWFGHELAQKQKAAAQKKAAPKPAEIEPLATVTVRSGGPAARVTKEKASMAQYIAIRDAEDKAKEKAKAARH